MPYHDLRDFIQILEKSGELVRINREVDRRLEISYVAAKSSTQEGPALLFQNVKGYRTPVFIGGMATWKSFFIAAESTRDAWPKKFLNALKSPMAWKTVEDGPCKEVIREGDKIDLGIIPALWQHEKDAGYYISSGVLAARDPETGIQNYSCHRAWICEKDRFPILLSVPTQVRQIAKKYMDAGHPCPVAYIVGTDPSVHIAAASKIPPSTDEMQFASSLRGKSVEMVKCETNDLCVPNTAEMVLEGQFLPGAEDGTIGKSVYMDEGPFGEFAGYYGERVRSPIFYLTGMSHRKDFIHYELVGYLPGRLQPLSHGQHTAVCWNGVRLVVPEERIKGIVVPLFSSFVNIISIKKAVPGEGKRVIQAAFAAQHTTTMVIVVDDDIDPYNLEQVHWAISTRTTKDDYFLFEGPGSQLHPTSGKPLAFAEYGNNGVCSKVGIDATIPLRGDKWGNRATLLDPCSMPLDQIDLNQYLAPEKRREVITA